MTEEKQKHDWTTHRVDIGNDGHVDGYTIYTVVAVPKGGWLVSQDDHGNYYIEVNADHGGYDIAFRLPTYTVDFIHRELKRQGYLESSDDD